MCTAVTFSNGDFYFGRNLDLEYSYKEEITVTPRNYPFTFRKMGEITVHPAIIGMSYNLDGYPLYYEATNEAGLSMAGLNFPGNAVYKPYEEGKDNVAPFEFIPWILCQRDTVKKARGLLSRINLVSIPFSDELPLATLHWIIADREDCVTVEAVEDGLKVYDNPIGILTNNPPFYYHTANLCNYMNLSSEQAVNRFSDKLKLEPYSRGMGAVGLPGDLSSASRFVRAAFTRLNSRCGMSEEENVSQFFHILGSVAQQKGCVHMGGGKYEYTIYSSCCNADKGTYYYTTYENGQVSAVDMHRENLDGDGIIAYPMKDKMNIMRQN